MKLRQILISGWFAMALMLIFSAVAGAEVVGRLTQLEGRVDLLKGGKLPAVALKLNDTVEPGDVVRTKSRSKAQITFIDNSLLTLSQNARMAIEEFKFDPGQGKRQALLNIFQGLALAVVNKILKAEEPDFVIKTQTAIMGVRGTEFGILNEPNSSTILNFKGRLQVGSISPKVSRLFLKASKVAFDWMPTGDSATDSSMPIPTISNAMILGDMQKAIVPAGQLPLGPIGITPGEYQNFLLKLLGADTSQANNQVLTFEDKEKLLLSILGDALFREYAQATTDQERIVVLNKALGFAASYDSSGSVLQVKAGPPGSQNTVNNLTTNSIPPKVIPQVQTAPPAPPPTPEPTHQSSPGYITGS
jgi:hypothetical protein